MPENNPGIITEPAVKRKPPHDKLKKFSDDTGCLLYNEEASEKIQCVLKNKKNWTYQRTYYYFRLVDSIPYSAVEKIK